MCNGFSDRHSSRECGYYAQAFRGFRSGPERRYEQLFVVDFAGSIFSTSHRLIMSRRSYKRLVENCHTCNDPTQTGRASTAGYYLAT